MIKHMPPQISVVVPVHNVEPYLGACVDSILAQTFSDFELILVDDGSTDRSGAICEEYAARDSRVRVIHRENGGLSAARNSGLEVAAGEYISFVDSDDLIAPDFLSRMMDVMLREKVRLVLCWKEDFKDEEPPALETGIDTPDSVRHMSGKTACLDRFEPSKRILITAWAKLYHRSLWEEHEFPVGKIHEDQFVVPMILYEAQEVALLDARLYFYRVRAGSITTSFTAKRFDNLEGMDRGIRFFQLQKEPELVKAAKLLKDKTMTLYNFSARSAGVTNYPKQYRMPILKALRKAKKYYGYDYYSRRLYQINPKLVRWSARLHKLSQILLFWKKHPEN